MRWRVRLAPANDLPGDEVEVDVPEDDGWYAARAKAAKMLGVQDPLDPRMLAWPAPDEPPAADAPLPTRAAMKRLLNGNGTHRP